MRPAEQRATAVGLDAATLERLSRLETHGRLILSVYIDLDPARFRTPPALNAQLGSLLDEARREGGEQDADRVEALVGADRALMQGARGLAVFCSVEAGIFEAVRLPGPVEPLAVANTVPWLEPLATMISPGDWAVAVVSRRGARLLRGGPRGLSEFARVRDEVHRRHAQGGWSQARFQRGIEEQVADHVRGVADRLARAHRRRPFADLVIVAADELRPLIEHSLHPELAELLAGTVDADLEHASVQGIAEAVAPLIEHSQRQREHELVDRLEQALGTGGPAAAGLDEVLSTLEQERVDTLLVAERSSLRAGLCPTCGRLSADAGCKCPLDGATLAEVDAVERAIEKAASQAAQVAVFGYKAEWLRQHGEIAALLRW